MRMNIANKRMHFSAPGNKKVLRILNILRERGLISGFVLDFNRPIRLGYWHGYPKYKVFLKYSFWGYPVIKKIFLYKSTKTNFNLLSFTKNNHFSRLENNCFYIINSVSGIRVINNNEFMKLPIDVKLLAKIKI